MYLFTYICILLYFPPHPLYIQFWELQEELSSVRRRRLYETAAVLSPFLLYRRDSQLSMLPSQG